MSRNDFSGPGYYESFICRNCGNTITAQAAGAKYRNHCPHCLWSRHVDLRTGDRRSGCRAMMEPIGIWVTENREWAVIHRCLKCGLIRTNRIAGDDSDILLFTLAARPITSLPFPFDRMLRAINSENSGSKRSGGAL